MAKRVVVVTYNEQWKTDFEIIKQHLFPAVKDLIISIEHIGSTSVEGLSAKPIIDIDIVIKDYSVFDTVVEKLASLSYIHEGNLGIKDREAFDYKGNADLPKHHLYVCPEFSAELHRHIAFRDYLRNNPEAVIQYSKVKEEGARLFPDSIDDYIAYKSPCIEEIYKEINSYQKECCWCNFTDAEKQNILYESVYWYVFLADKQDYLDRCVVVLKRHCTTLSQLDLSEWIELKEIITKFEDCFKNVLGADLCNWSCLMNDFYKSVTPNPHLHMHVRPRYNKAITINDNSYVDVEFGHHYNPKKETMLSDKDRKILFEKIKNYLNLEKK